MASLMSPRLPGVHILRLDATGPEYSRWRRGVKFASETKGTWKYCNGEHPMPMPEAGLNRKSQNDATKSIQPSLLEERRAWVRQDREAKLDIFLSLAEEVMQDVFEVGPPLPPSNLNAKELLDALDKRFTVFKFETYHHAFCHFLNLHIDQYVTVEDFNTEFSATLEDLLDYGQPLSNIQACSAYFSKLRCTQNPWVAKQLESWHTQSSEPELVDLLRSSPPWSCVRPLITKSSQNFHVESIPEIPEEPLGDGSIDSDSDSTSERSNVSTMSSKISHSRHVSSTTAHSQEITIHASSEDIAEIDRLDHCRDLEALPTSTIQEYPSSKDLIPETPTPNVIPETPTIFSEWINAKARVPRMPFPAPIDRPLPPLPVQTSEMETQSRSASPRDLTKGSKNSLQSSMTVPAPTTASQPLILKLETTHPTLRPRTPSPSLKEHPALREKVSTLNLSTEQSSEDSHRSLGPRMPTPQPPIELHPALHHRKPASAPAQAITARPSLPPLQRPDFVSSSPNLAVPWPSTPDVPQRPHSSRAAFPMKQAQLSTQQHETVVPQHNQVFPELSPLLLPQLNRVGSTNSSIISLPLQGTRDSAWDYLYERKNAPREHSVSPIESHSASPPPPVGGDITALPQLKGTLSRAPTFTDLVAENQCSNPPEDKPLSKEKGSKLHAKSSSLDFVARLGGDGVVELSEEARERELAKKQRKKRSWSVNVNLSRFSTSKGVKEII